MRRRLGTGSAIAVVLAATLLAGSGAGSSAAVARGTHAIPASLAAAIHARLGALAIRSSAAASGLDPNLGSAVSLSADATTALVGALGVGNGKGAAYIFHSTGAGSWSSSSIPTATLTSAHSTATAYFGAAVALSADGTTAFVGAPLNGGILFGAGAIYVFHVSAEDEWADSSTPTAALSASHSVLLGAGLAVSADGTTLVAGAPLYSGGAGGAYVYHAASEALWASSETPIATLSNASESSDDSGVGFLVAVSGNGTTALLSDPHNSSGGGAYVYHVSAANAWASKTSPTAILSDADSAATDDFGDAVALSADGKLALLGAPGTSPTTGAVDVFHASSQAAWASTAIPTATLTKAGGKKGDSLGFWLAASNDGTTALVSAPGVGSGRGAAYVYHASGESAWADTSTPTARLSVSGAHPGDNLGTGVVFSTDGTTALVGAPGVNLTTGAAYVFHVADVNSWVTSSTPGATLRNKALAVCVVPTLKGLSLAPAKNALAVGRCTLGTVTKVNAKKWAKGRVFYQSRKPGRRLAIHAKIAVRIGK